MNPNLLLDPNTIMKEAIKYNIARKEMMRQDGKPSAKAQKHYSKQSVRLSADFHAKQRSSYQKRSRLNRS